MDEDDGDDDADDDDDDNGPGYDCIKIVREDWLMRMQWPGGKWMSWPLSHGTALQRSKPLLVDDYFRDDTTL